MIDDAPIKGSDTVNGVQMYGQCEGCSCQRGVDNKKEALSDRGGLVVDHRRLIYQEKEKMKAA